MTEAADDSPGERPAELLEEPVSGLRYRLRRTARAGVPVAPVARVLLLHGVGGSEADLAMASAWLDPAIEVLLVRGPLVLGPQQFAWFRVCFSARGPVVNAEQAEQSRARLLAMIHALHERDGAAPLRTVVAGFSQGGILSASVGLSAPREVIGFAMMSGRVLPELEPAIAPRAALGSLSAFVAHGRFDDKLPVSWADRARDQLDSLGVRHRIEIFPIGHELNRAVVASFSRWLDETLAYNTSASELD